jgi:hypothetical protein
MDLVIRNRLRESPPLQSTTTVRVSGGLCSYAPPWRHQVCLPIGDDILIRNFVPRTRAVTHREFLQQAVTGSMAMVARAATHEPLAAYAVPRAPVEKNG